MAIYQCGFILLTNSFSIYIHNGIRNGVWSTVQTY